MTGDELSQVSTMEHAMEHPASEADAEAWSGTPTRRNPDTSVEHPSVQRDDG